MDADLYCWACNTRHTVAAVASGDLLPYASKHCRVTELEARIECAADLITMAAESGVWGLAEEALDVVLSLNDAAQANP